VDGLVAAASRFASFSDASWYRPAPARGAFSLRGGRRARLGAFSFGSFVLFEGLRLMLCAARRFSPRWRETTERVAGKVCFVVMSLRSLDWHGATLEVSYSHLKPSALLFSRRLEYVCMYPKSTINSACSTCLIASNFLFSPTHVVVISSRGIQGCASHSLPHAGRLPSLWGRLFVFNTPPYEGSAALQLMSCQLPSVNKGKTVWTVRRIRVGDDVTDGNRAPSPTKYFHLLR